MAQFEIVLPDGQRHEADLRLLQKYSKYYEKGFDGRFVEKNESYLIHNATHYTVAKFLAVINYMEANENHDPDYINLYPLQWNNEEHWDELIDLWFLADFLLAKEVKKFVEDYLHTKIVSPGEGHRALTAAEFNFFWHKLQTRYHKSLQDIMITAIMASPEFNDSKESRAVLLDRLPADAERAILHVLMDRMAATRELVNEVLVEVKKDNANVWSWRWSSACDGLMAMFNCWHTG